MPSSAGKRRRDKGSGSLYRRSDDGRWVGYVTLPDDPRTGARRRKTVTARTKEGAARKLRDLRRELDRAGDLPTEVTNVEQWMTLWLDRIAAPRLKPRTLATYRGYAARYILPTIGRVSLTKVTPAHVRRVHDRITGEGLSTTTARQAHQILKKALQDAEREGRIARNPADLVDSPRRAFSTRGGLSADDARRLLLSAARDDREGALWATALLAGLRQGERLGLTTETVDLDAGIITVAWQLQRLPWEHGCGERDRDGSWPCGRMRGGNCPQRVRPIPSDQEVRRLDGLWLTRPKSRAGWREVPICGQLEVILERYMQAYPPGRDNGLIFTRAGGRAIDPAADTRAWDAACRRAGVPDVPLHSARHTTATLLRDLGVDEQTRMQILGHSSATVTAGYTHVASRDMRAALDGLGQLLGS